MFGFDPYSTKPYSTINPVYGRILSAISTSTVSIVKAVRITMLDAVAQAASIIAVVSKFVVMVANSSSVVSIQRNIGKYLTIVVNSAIIISKFLTKTIALTSSVIASLYAGAISFSRYARDKVIYARDSLRELSSVKFKTITGPLRQFRSVAVTKFRTLFARKGPEV